MVPRDLENGVLRLVFNGFSSPFPPSLWGVLGPLSFIAPYPSLTDWNLKNKLFSGKDELALYPPHVVLYIKHGFLFPVYSLPQELTGWEATSSQCKWRWNLLSQAEPTLYTHYLLTQPGREMLFLFLLSSGETSSARECSQ